MKNVDWLHKKVTLKTESKEIVCESVKEALEKLHISRSTFSLWVKGKGKPENLDIIVSDRKKHIEL